MIGSLTSGSQLYFLSFPRPRPIYLLPSSSIVIDLQELQCSRGYAVSRLTPRPLTRTITSRASTFYTDPSKDQEPGVSTSPNISLEQREILDNALRVDQAGEIAANWIYRGQITILGRDPRIWAVNSSEPS
jgi:hypothetical protein